MKPRFGPISERELDIAEFTYRGLVENITLMANGGIAARRIAESVLVDNVRGMLRFRLEGDEVPE